MCMFRDLKADEIECRVGQASEKGLSLLLYKDARVDMAILDSVVGQARWQREHYEVKGNLYCRVGIKIDNEWIWKSDCGTESNTEAQKGESSDSFKRSCVNWGIGRELYTAPFIWIGKDDCNLKAVQVNNKTIYRCSDSFTVTDIHIKDKVITGLAIKNDKLGKVVYTYGTCRGQQKPSNTPSTSKADSTSGLPFPEVEKSPIPEDINEARKWAVNFTVSSGTRAGMTLGEIRKVDKAAYTNLMKEPPSAECAAAIKIINDWVNGQ